MGVLTYLADADQSQEREQTILAAHFPNDLPGDCEPREGSCPFERIDAQLVGALLGKAANTSAPGDDRISAGIVKVFRQ